MTTLKVIWMFALLVVVTSTSLQSTVKEGSVSKFQESNLCQNVICPRGTRCELKETQCLTKPCPVLAICQELFKFPEVCELPPKPGNCAYSYVMWYYDAASMDCKKFTYTGCGGNANKYSTKLRCEESCVRRDMICTLSPETGPCRARMDRWYYDVTAKTCQLFIYGGCRGNQNNFRSFDSCMAKCGRTD
ncbi:hypothetical protein ScPMuIL_012189 [Solemya velum]